MKQQIGGFLALAGFLVIVGATGWWWLTRGGVIDREELFSQAKVTIPLAGPVATAFKLGDDKEGAWKLGPYSLEPADSPVNVTGSFLAAGALSEKRPRFTLTAHLFDANDKDVWHGQSRIDWANQRSGAKASALALDLGMIPIREAGEYTLYCNTDEESSSMGGLGTGAMKLDLVIRRQDKPFPWIPVAVGFGMAFIAAIGFGKPVKR